MAKTKWRDCTVLVGTANPPTTQLTNKKDVVIDGLKQITDDTTTDDSTGPEHDVIFAGDITSAKHEIIVDRAEASYLILEAAAEGGTKIYVSLRPQGNGAGTKREYIFQTTVDLSIGKGSAGMARADVTYMKTGGVTKQTQPA